MMKEVEVDLHGYHPYSIEGLIENLVQQAWEIGVSGLKLIHGHGHNRGNSFPQFVHTNTGFLGLTVRSALRRRVWRDGELRRYMLVKFDTSDSGVTTVRLRPNPNPSRTKFDDLPERDYDF